MILFTELGVCFHDQVKLERQFFLFIPDVKTLLFIWPKYSNEVSMHATDMGHLEPVEDLKSNCFVTTYSFLLLRGGTDV